MKFRPQRVSLTKFARRPPSGAHRTLDSRAKALLGQLGRRERVFHVSKCCHQQRTALKLRAATVHATPRRGGGSVTARRVRSLLPTLLPTRAHNDVAPSRTAAVGCCDLS